MRKFLWMAAVSMLVLAVAAPTMAFDFKFGGQARARFYDYVNVGFNSDWATQTVANPFGFGPPTLQTMGGAGSNDRAADIRFRARFDASDDNGNVQGVLRLRVGNVVFGAGGGVQNPVNFPEIGSTGFFNGGNTSAATPYGRSTGGSIGTRGVNVETEWAYLDFALPWGIPVRARMGLMPWYEAKGMIIDDNVAGVKLYGTVAPVSYEVAWYRLSTGGRLGNPFYTNAIGVASRNRQDTTDNAYDVYGGKIGVAIAPWLNPDVYGYYGDNRVNCTPPDNNNTGSPSPLPICNSDRVRPNYYIGVDLTGKIAIVDYDVNFVYGWAKGGANGAFVNTGPGTVMVLGGGTPYQPGTNGNAIPAALFNSSSAVDVRGWALDAGVHFPIGPITWSIVGSYATGDKQDGGSSSNAFPGGYSPAWNGPGSQYDWIGNSGASGLDAIASFASGITNIWTVGTYVDYKPVKALNLRASYAYIGFAQAEGNCAWLTPADIARGQMLCYGPQITSKGFVSAPTLTTLGGFVNVGQGGLAGKSTLGNDMELRADYQLWTGFTITGVAAWLVPTTGDTAAKYGIEFVYNW